MAASKNLTPEQRVLRARIAANTRWSQEDGKANAQRAHAGLRAKFRRQVEAESPGLSDAELERRVDCAYRAHMQRLSFAASRARSNRSGGNG
ncbi:MAG: hypothetical protein GEV10_13795 [Streptosporangiales bacterium]|nr:hypothetical protein [Streptosporangiales bacterium]